MALYSQPCEYHKTPNTCVCFYDYDIRFDGKNGLYEAIYRNDGKLLEKYIQRFEGVKYFISPDHSECGDIPQYHNIHRLGRAREVSLWLSIELHAAVIPNIACCRESDLEYFCDGLEDVSIIAFSTKGKCNQAKDIELLKKTITVSLDKLHKLKTIIVYDVSSTNNVVREIFKPAIDKQVNILIPDNILKRNNIRRLKHVQ